MTKLLDILLESIKESKPIKLDKSVFPQIDKIFNIFKSYNNEETKEYLKNGGKPIKLDRIKFDNRYNFKFNGVTVWLHYKDNEDTLATYSSVNGTIGININSDIGSKESIFKNALHHELIHAVDPKLNRKKVSNSYYEKQAKKYNKDVSSLDYTKYLKQPAEFDAWSSSYISDIENALEKLPEEDKKQLRSSLRIFINYLLKSSREYTNLALTDNIINSIASEMSNSIGKDLYVINDLGFNGDEYPTGIFMGNLIHYLSKPSLFKKYVQRLATLL